MGQAYVDDHRFWLYKNGAGVDITEAVTGPELRDELSALSVELTFQAVRNNIKDRYMHWCNAEPGDKLRVLNHGTEIFSGTVLTVGLDGSITANDPGWYLSKSEIIFQCSSVTAGDAVRRMCAKAGIPAGAIDLPPTRISDAWPGSTPESILADILKICGAETGRTYRYRVEGGKLNVGPLTTESMIAYHKPTADQGAFDITLAKGEVTGADSMADLCNSVLLTESGGDAARVLGRAFNAASIEKYGLVQQVERLTGDENTAQARQRIKNLLAAGDRITKEREVSDIWGADEVRSGVLLQFKSNSYGVTGLQRVTAVTHRYGKAHRMSLTVEAYNAERAAGSGDTITV
ncbi:hypothetical protein [uncultured Oscillibacter sp.]|uniref:XkdQ/YqbQ family protein n=1 Tax=uncultured Oscillibacter sp. TaxID=876091 RepID=UPI0025DEB9F5|nr:hypothetical protein [uncultured Oscillibacter sp.]